MKTNISKFSVGNHKALKLIVQTLRSYLKLICQHDFRTLPNTKVGATKDVD